jgi:hypothetical protein
MQIKKKFQRKQNVSRYDYVSWQKIKCKDIIFFPLECLSNLLIMIMMIRF